MEEASDESFPASDPPSFTPEKLGPPAGAAVDAPAHWESPGGSPPRRRDTGGAIEFYVVPVGDLWAVTRERASDR